MSLAKVMAGLSIVALTLTAMAANANAFDNRRGNDWRRDDRREDRRDDRRPGNGGWGGGGGRLGYQYAGQRQGPINGSPYGINYCNTENPGQCYRRGEMCYTNSGYWWDNANQCNWFNVYECR